MPRWRSLLRKARWALPAALVAIAVAVVASLALADNVQNEIVAGVGGDRVRTVIAGNSTTVMYGIQATGSMGLCDAADGTSVTVTPNGMPAGVTATPASISFSNCPSPTGVGAKGIVYNVPASTPALDYTINVTTADAAGSYNTAPARFILRVQAPPPPADTTAPVIVPTVVGTEGNGTPPWYTSDVNVTWSVTDAQSAITSTSGCDATTISTDTTGVTLTCEATSAGGTDSESVTIRRDATPPTLAPSVSPNPVLLNGSATATPNAGDATSGVASSSCATPDTSSVGQNKTVACTATDNAGNVGNATASYSVIFNFAGFFQPVDNLPAINTVKAGSAVPVKFSLSGNQGLSIFAAGHPKAITTSCTSATEDAIESTSTAGNSGLSYDALADQYVYVWKTEKSWTGCRQLVVKLTDGTSHVANFKLK